MAERAQVRCAVYTRKSSEEGLEQSFNSLHAQREACEAYVLSQKHEGWTLVPTAYDDGGFSGGSMQRPGLQSLLAAIEAGLIDTVVVYKVDRLTRSLADFAKMVERFDARGVSFVSVTQAFNTTTSMGRLTLNVLLSFAQFEREVTGERIRDKIAASKAKGMWMGGAVPLGYDVVERMLVVNEPEAEQVRTLFSMYAKLKSVDDVVVAAAKAGITSKQRMSVGGRASGGTKLGRGSLYKIFANPIYVGEIGHKEKRYPGQHSGIIEPALFDTVQSVLEANRRKARGSAAGASALLSGLVTDASGHRMTATHTGKAHRRYRYYASPSLRVPAEELETLVVEAIATTLDTPETLAAALPDLSLLSDDLLASAAKIGLTLKQADASERRALMLELKAAVQLADASVVTAISLAALGAEGAATITTTAVLWRAKASLSLVVPGSTAPRPDHALITAIAQARSWLQQLASGEAASLAELAAADGVSPAYVRHLIGSAFLAPDLVTRIVEGRQPQGLTLSRLRELLPLPGDWTAQRALFAAAA